MLRVIYLKVTMHFSVYDMFNREYVTINVVNRLYSFWLSFFFLTFSVCLCLSLSLSLSRSLSLSLSRSLSSFWFVEDPSQENGVIQTQYSAISPPASPVAQDEPFSTYFEERVPIPDDADQV